MEGWGKLKRAVQCVIKTFIYMFSVEYKFLKTNFLLQVMRHENASILELDGKEVSEFTPSKPREKWLRKRTHVKIRVRNLFVFNCIAFRKYFGLGGNFLN